MSEVTKPWIIIGPDLKGRIVVEHHARAGISDHCPRLSGPFQNHAELLEHLIVTIFPVGRRFTDEWERLKQRIYTLVEDAAIGNEGGEDIES